MRDRQVAAAVRRRRLGRIRGRVLTAGAAAVTGMALAGCAGIPNTGPVQPGATVLAEGQDPVIRVVARPPAPDMQPAEVVRGFLDASASSDGDHAIARMFLTPTAASRWRPDSVVRVYDQVRNVNLHQVRPRKVVATSWLNGVIDGRGAFRPLPDRRDRSLFHLRRVGGQWRIDRLPQGTWLTPFEVQSGYRPVSLYFVDATGKMLVPDPIQLPTSDPGPATRLVESLLAGPTAWLAPAVRTAFPSGTQLVVDAVPVQNGIAHVDLTQEVLTATTAERGQLIAQLVWTLNQLPDVTAVAIDVQGQPLPTGTVTRNQTTSEWLSFSPDAPVPADAGYVVTARGVAQLVHGRARQVVGAIGRAGPGLSGVAVSADQVSYAALAAAGTEVVVQRPEGGGRLTTIASGARFVAPVFDADGSLWLLGTADGVTFVRVVTADGRVTPVRLPPLLRHHRVVAWSVASDSARVAIVVGEGSRARLFLARITRTSPSQGGPGAVSVGGLRPWQYVLDDVEAVSWADAEHVTVIAAAPNSARQPYVVSLTGSVQSVSGALPGLTTIASAPGQPLLGATRRGQVWQDSGNGWRLLTRGGYPTYAG
jgi:hypothetical protein